MILDVNNIYVKESNNQPTTRFSDTQQNVLFKLEDKSWWFQYRANVIREIASLYYNKEDLTIDIGGGNGYTTFFLEKNGFRMGLLEPSYQACLNGKKRGVSYIINGSIDELENRNGQYFLLDVLEHIEDDDNFLISVREKMDEGGRILITVPAFMSLWSNEDVKAGHFRRYNMKNIIPKIKKNGFEVLYSNYFFSFLYIPIFFFRVCRDKIIKIVDSPKEDSVISGSSGRHLVWGNSFIYKILMFIERLELKRLITKKKMYFGSSLILVIKKH